MVYNRRVVVTQLLKTYKISISESGIVRVVTGIEQTGNTGANSRLIIRFGNNLTDIVSSVQTASDALDLDTSYNTIEPGDVLRYTYRKYLQGNSGDYILREAVLCLPAGIYGTLNTGDKTPYIMADYPVDAGLTAKPIAFLELRLKAKGHVNGVPNANESVLEIGDHVEGWKDTVTYWTTARYNGGDEALRSSYTGIVENDIIFE